MPAPKCHPRPLVLKFGGSILGAERGVELAAECVQRERARHPGAGVVVVVSALGATTDRLFEEARVEFGGDEVATAGHVGAGEADAVRLMAAALGALGTPAEACSPQCLGLVTSGSVLDGDPVALNVDGLRDELYPEGAGPAVIVARGFVALDANGRPSLLGRGGSDLTALFVAHHLDACDCVLLKDVDGIHVGDPKAPGDRTPRRLSELGFGGLEAFGGRVLQPKAARFAVRHRRGFSLGSLDRPALRTRVG